jgi:catechol 2,3-dioxygenase-like lactoylglutathione lyase family enzyme
MQRDTLHEQHKPTTAAPEKLAYRNTKIDVGALKPAAADGVQLALRGVDHTARPTWKLRETVTFYRDILGLPLIHTISARGWGHADHADFLHFFFDAGNGATIAFFYYIGTERPEKYQPVEHPFSTATHTAWAVDTMDELRQWKETLEGRGIPVSNYTRHEALESIYFRDPNGYPVEITLRLRDVEEVDAKDAALTLEAAMQLEDAAAAAGQRMKDIDSVWRRKAKLVEEYLGAA